MAPKENMRRWREVQTELENVIAKGYFIPTNIEKTVSVTWHFGEKC